MLTNKKIYIKKYVHYYNEKKQLTDVIETEKKEVESLEQARQIINAYDLQAVTNKKGVSVAESIGYIWSGPDGTIYREKREKDPFTKREF